MSDAKRAPLDRAITTPSEVASFIRSHGVGDAPQPPAGLGDGAPILDVEAFLEDWALRHFTVSVKLHDAERLSEGDAERLGVLEELAVVQGVLIELHEFATGSPDVHALLASSQVVQNGAGALYAWLDDVLDAALLHRVARGRPAFVDAGPDALPSITRALERVHPDLEALVHGGEAGGVAHKLALCFRQIGAAVVRVSGRASSLPAPPR